MPRQPDPELEARVLKAAARLWSSGGQANLTMRAVAKAAGTTTPAVYRRFKSQRGLVRALLQKNQAALGAEIQRCNSLPEVCHCVFEYALRHPRDYELIASRAGWSSDRRRPNFEYVLKKCEEWLGGPAENYRPLVIALWSLVHGSAMLLIAGGIPEPMAKVRAAFTAAVDELVRNHDRFVAERLVSEQAIGNA